MVLLLALVTALLWSVGTYLVLQRTLPRIALGLLVLLQGLVLLLLLVTNRPVAPTDPLLAPTPPASVPAVPTPAAQATAPAPETEMIEADGLVVTPLSQALLIVAVLTIATPIITIFLLLDLLRRRERRTWLDAPEQSNAADVP